MADVIDVDTASLRAVAAQIEAAGERLSRPPGPVPEVPDFGPAATAALHTTTATWIGYLTALGIAVATTGADLSAVADLYAGAEADARPSDIDQVDIDGYHIGEPRWAR
jgi:hypothetical protein